MTVKVRRHVFVRELLVNQQARLITDSDAAYPSLQSTALPAMLGPSDTPILAVEDGRQPVTVLFTVAGDNKAAAVRRFFADFDDEVLVTLEPVKLVIVVFRQDDQDSGISNLIHSLTESLQKEYPGVSLVIIEKIGQFSRGVGLTEGLKACEDTDLMFILDVDIYFNSAALENVRRFTGASRSAYFPIIFSEFRDGGGFWRSFGYGILAAYKADIVAAGGYNTGITGWGKEDVDLYDKLLKTGINVVRSTDTNILHKYHKVTIWVNNPKLIND